MENRKDIGIAFKEKLNALSQTPSEKNWEDIQAELENKHKRKFAFILFWCGTVAFSIVASICYYYFQMPNADYKNSPLFNSKQITIIDHNHKNKKNSVAVMNSNDDNQKRNKSLQSEKSIENKNSGTENYVSINKKSNNNSELSTAFFKTTGAKSILKTKSKLEKKSDLLRKKTSSIVKLKNSKQRKNSKSNQAPSSKKELILMENSSDFKNSETILQNESLKSIASKITKVTDTTASNKTKEKKQNILMFPKDSVQKDSAKIYRSFHFDAFVSPTLYGYFAKASSLDHSLNSYSKMAKISFSYGIGLTYDLSDKIAVRIGYSHININYLTLNVPTKANNYNGINYKPNLSNATIYNASNRSENMDVTQEISYIEIPLEVKYKFLDKKTVLNSCFGFSYLLLTENRVKIKTPDGFSQNIGKTKNLSDESISIIVGIEAEYPLFKKIRMYVEPLFNYQIKGFSEQNYKPYFFGIHTGVRYSFKSK